MVREGLQASSLTRTNSFWIHSVANDRVWPDERTKWFIDPQFAGSIGISKIRSAHESRTEVPSIEKSSRS